MAFHTAKNSDLASLLSAPQLRELSYLVKSRLDNFMSKNRSLLKYASKLIQTSFFHRRDHLQRVRLESVQAGRIDLFSVLRNIQNSQVQLLFHSHEFQGVRGFSKVSCCGHFKV